MKLTRRFFEDHLLTLQPEVLKVVIQLLYEREWIGVKSTRKSIAKRFGLSEHHARTTLELLQSYSNGSRAKTKSRRQLASKPEGQTSTKAPIIPPKTSNGKLFSAEFPQAQDPDSSAEKVQQALGEGLTFEEGWEVSLTKCRLWHEAKSGKISNPTLAMMNWASQAKKHDRIKPIPEPKSEMIVIKEDLSIGWE